MLQCNGGVYTGASSDSSVRLTVNGIGFRSSPGQNQVALLIITHLLLFVIILMIHRPFLLRKRNLVGIGYAVGSSKALTSMTMWRSKSWRLLSPELGPNWRDAVLQR
jgi:hypothetical protein